VHNLSVGPPKTPVLDALPKGKPTPIDRTRFTARPMPERVSVRERETFFERVATVG